MDDSRRELLKITFNSGLVAVEILASEGFLKPLLLQGESTQMLAQ